MNEQILYQAVGLHQAGDMAGAVRLYGEFLRSNPGHFQALYMLGYAYHQAGQFDAAAQAMAEALRANPRSPDAYYLLGASLQRLNRAADAIAAFDRALGLRPDFADALVDRSAALLTVQRYADALASADAALAADAKAAGAWNNRGCALQRMNRHKDALAAFEQALALDPGFTDARINRGTSLFETKHYAEAARDYDDAYARDAKRPYLKGNRLLYRLYCCDWRDFEAERAGVDAGVAAGEPVVLPFVHTVLSPDPAAQRHSAELWALRELPQAAAPLWRGETYDHTRIRVAYVSADFHAHATAHLMAGVFEAHDRDRFEIAAISFGPDDAGAMRQRLLTSFDSFTDVRGRTDAEAASLMRQMEIDVAIDLKGYTLLHRAGIFAHRPAPVQASYLGYPGTMGVDFMDYILADRHVIPAADTRFYSEKIAYLPDSYQCNDSKREIAATVPARAEAGLPEGAFVFCCFNNNFKIAPAMFDVWMGLLRDIDGSVLWLLENDAAAAHGLRAEAQARGIAAERLVFAPRAKPPEHLARHRLADLFLDTLPYGAHTTASDALYAGLPVLTCTGTSFAGRVGTSLVHAAGVPELAMPSLDAYRDMALKLAREPETLAALKAKLARHRDVCALFDTARITRHLESAYETMLERARRGQRPETFHVEARP
jgi:predicted O-linked N-acetylglucosamine transferase (SPINDLY family)